MDDVDAEYEYEAGPPLRVRVHAWWERVFGDWWPDQRSLGVLLVAVYLTGAISNLALADLSWRAFTETAQTALGYPTEQVVVGAARLVAIPASVLVVAGGIGLAVRSAWARGLAVAGLAALLAVELLESIVSVLQRRGPEGVRFGVLDVVSSLGAALVLAVLLWSRPAADAG
ncbi:MAG TPA: hypothetical protein VN193_07270 [Candidatus Angelobacter sp.]|jgi:hypothetical protein|nr:hypothetical protein [Candidatus Angelobacter sp.]